MSSQNNRKFSMKCSVQEKTFHEMFCPRKNFPWHVLSKKKLSIKCSVQEKLSMKCCVQEKTFHKMLCTRKNFPCNVYPRKNFPCNVLCNKKLSMKCSVIVYKKGWYMASYGLSMRCFWIFFWFTLNSSCCFRRRKD